MSLLVGCSQGALQRPDGATSQDGNRLDLGGASDTGGVSDTSGAADTSAASDATSDAPLAQTLTWTHDGFDITINAALSAAPWDAFTKEHYVVVSQGETVSLTIARNATLNDADGKPDTRGKTKVHLGPLTVRHQQMWTPNWDEYDAGGSYEYEGPFAVGPVNAPTVVQIWNEHPGISFDDSAWLAYGSNAIQVWMIPWGTDPGNVPPPSYSNGRIRAGMVTTAPPGRWPALFKDAVDEQRLQNAMSKFTSTVVRQPNGPYDRRGDGNYWRDLGRNAAVNALIGYSQRSQPHLDAARGQLLALFSVPLFGHGTAGWYRARCNPNSDLLTTYGRELSNAFFQALVAAFALGPNMANALNSAEREAINAHLYRFAVHEIYNTLTNDNSYTADGGINLHVHPISVVAGWIWGISDAENVADSLSFKTQTECSYFVDGNGHGQYALRYCQKHDPNDKSYEDVGNSQSVRYWVRFAEFFGKTIDVPTAEQYVVTRFGGRSYSTVNDALAALMDGWQP